MTFSASVVTTFPTTAWKSYAERMVQSFVENWPAQIPILVRLDDDLLEADVQKLLREQDAVVSGMSKDETAFVERNKGKDDPQDYRKQAVRFCHKVFVLKSASDYWVKQNAIPDGPKCRYLIWFDADVLTTRKVTLEEIQVCLPKEGDAVSYLGRKDWPHSECGWLAFDLENGGDKIINEMVEAYISDNVFTCPQWHDSWIFDTVVMCGKKATNLTPDAVGMEVWPQSPMAAWSKHYKGPIAKHELNGGKVQKQGGMQPLRIETTNSLPNEKICQSVLENQTQIKNWLIGCERNDEEVVVVSAGPMLMAEDLLEEVAAGRKIVAVKHALKPLKAAGIKVWGCILLDPREHVYDFVENPDKDIIWFVASQVTPRAVKSLLDAGCNVWGYHASVGAGESKYTEKQPHAIIDGGSATATRGLFLLEKLGFRKFRLYGYDLCLTKKPDLSLRDDKGQPVNFEIEMGLTLPFHKDFRWFWSKGELLAQADEFQKILEIKRKKWEVKAFGAGVAPFLTNIWKINDLRLQAKLDKMPIHKPVGYEELLGCKMKTPLSRMWHKMLRLIHLSPPKDKTF